MSRKIIKPTNGAKALEVTKLLFGRIKIVADFGRDRRTKAVISAKAAKEYLSLKQDNFLDPGGKLLRMYKKSDGWTYLYFVPNKGFDLVVVNTSDLVAALK